MGKKAHSYAELATLIKQGCDTFAEIRTNGVFVLFHKLHIDNNGNIHGECYYPDGNLSGNRNNPSNRIDFVCSFTKPNSNSQISSLSGNPNTAFGATYFEEYKMGQTVTYSGSNYNYSVVIK